MNNRGPHLYTKAKRLIPGGTQLLSKRPEMFLPDHWPAYYARCKGVHVWDLDGRRYIDATIHGVGSCVLGYADPDVDRAVMRAIQSGTMCTLNCPEEVELAELLCDLHPWAEMVRYARTGGEAMAVAIRIARAASGRDKVAFCGYHGWHDWYLSANLANNRNLDGQLLPGLKPRGVPRALVESATPFLYGDKESFSKIARKWPGKLAAVVMEPARSQSPDISFLKFIQREARRLGAVLIFDEITSGWREAVGGIHLNLGVQPDMAVFAKGMSNGYPMAAILGKASVMKAAQHSFISSTYWTDKIGPSAALVTIRKLRKLGAPQHLKAMGKLVQDGWKELSSSQGVSIKVSGLYPLSHFDFLDKPSMVYKTLFTQMLLEKGYLASNSFYVSCAHDEKIIQRYLNQVEGVFGRLRHARAKGHLIKLLKGPLAHTGFKRLA